PQDMPFAPLVQVYGPTACVCPYSSTGVPADAGAGAGPPTHGVVTPSASFSTTVWPVVPVHPSDAGTWYWMFAIVQVPPSGDM
uniref:hypothetical protein n=1 Tax=Cellulomonas sp. GbtcB1 TaxID=2824746 RepID=UPI001C2F2F35